MTEYQGDFGKVELDPQERQDAELNLDDPSAGDNEPWTPPERLPRAAEMDGLETEGGETLDQRLQQEEPDVGPTDGEDVLMEGGDDPAAIAADEDVLGGEPGSDRPAVGDSPEESAMRVVEGDL